MAIESITFADLFEGEEAVLEAVAHDPQLLIDIALELKGQVDNEEDDSDDNDSEQEIEAEALDIFSPDYDATEDLFQMLNPEARTGLETLVGFISKREDKYALLFSLLRSLEKSIQDQSETLDIVTPELLGDEEGDDDSDEEIDYSESLNIKFNEKNAPDEQGVVYFDCKHTTLLVNMYEYISHCIAKVFPEIKAKIEAEKKKCIARIYYEDFSMRLPDLSEDHIDFGDEIEVDPGMTENMEKAAEKYWPKNAGTEICQILEVLARPNAQPPSFEA